MKGLKRFTNFEFLIFVCMLMYRAGDIEKNPGPNTSFIDSSLVHYNVQSLSTKIDLIESELTHFDLISISESWLNPSIKDDDINLSGFKPPYRNDRTQDPHGGVAVYVKDSFYSKCRSDLEIHGIECVWVEVCIKHKSVLVGTFYRPPNSISAVLDNILASIDLAFDTGIKDIIITGDFNLDYLKTNTKKKVNDINL